MNVCVCVRVCAGTCGYMDVHYGYDMDARVQPQVGPQELSILVFRDGVFHWDLGLTNYARLIDKSLESLPVSASSMLG